MPALDGVRIIDLTRVLAGPFCTMMLGDMGAEVIKVEEPTHGDESRGWQPIVNGWSSYFLGVNRNKKSVALDLKDPDAAAALRSLLAGADVLVENFRPGSLAELGFGYADVATVNPRLIYCSISGYGQSGPRSGQSGYDVVIQGESGLMDVTGQPDGPPTRVGIAITDYLAGLYAAQGILLALLDRQHTGQGQHVDIALLDSLVSALTLPVGILFATGQSPHRMGNDHPSIAPYETVRARDGMVIVAAGNPRLWTQLCAALEVEHLATDSRFSTNTDRLTNRAALKDELETALQRYSIDDALARLEACNVPCGRVRTIAEAIEDPQLLARDMVVAIEHPDLGTIKNLGNPIKLSRSPAHMRLPPPRLGEHTEAVLAECAGSSPLVGRTADDRHLRQ
jgi:crotonobetainyl-CoA:carnitine CoA-transferase CaiB-like acyl-CoA transferase